jgi:hypothetical protein
MLSGFFSGGNQSPLPVSGTIFGFVRSFTYFVCSFTCFTSSFLRSRLTSWLRAASFVPASVAFLPAQGSFIEVTVHLSTQRAHLQAVRVHFYVHD